MYHGKSNELNDFIGETVTIFTTSGGMSGSGFTGVVIFADECFVRLVTCIGPAPGCALGNACCKNFKFGCGNSFDGGYDSFNGGHNGFGGGYKCGGGYKDGGYGGCGIGSVVDIPISRIAAIVRNAV